MLKVRVLPTLLYKDHGLVKGVGFDPWRRVGSAMQAVKVYNLRGVDELCFLDIGAAVNNREPCYEVVDELADECFVPLTVGGGIRDIEHVRRLLRAGADRVTINTAAVERPGFVGEISDRFGTQSVVVSIDAEPRGHGYEVVTRCGTRPTALDPIDLAVRVEEEGAGEILLTSIVRDGTMQGYDLDLIRRVVDHVRIPVIASGGAGTFDHLVDAVVQAGASAVAAASMFHFTERTPREAKEHLARAGVPVRL